MPIKFISITRHNVELRYASVGSTYSFTINTKGQIQNIDAIDPNKVLSPYSLVMETPENGKNIVILGQTSDDGFDRLPHEKQEQLKGASLIIVSVDLLSSTTDFGFVKKLKPKFTIFIGSKAPTKKMLGYWDELEDCSYVDVQKASRLIVGCDTSNLLIQSIDESFAKNQCKKYGMEKPRYIASTAAWCFLKI